ncbi:MAG: hypothetical protein IJW63_02175 [Lachnospiraceae bacterium]|nr:hypothetical protein [Lachnospiraceae bacterium]
METLKKIAKAILFPPIALVIILVPIAICMLIYAFVYVGTEHIFSYLAYFISAYTLTIVSVRTPAIIRFCMDFKKENQYLKRYFSDATLRINVSLYTTLFINTAYALLQLGLGFYHNTIWYYSLSAYYVLLAVMRFFLLKHTRNHVAGADRVLELLIYRFCGMLLVLLHTALSAIVFYIVWQNRGFVHHPITTIAMAAYTFFSLTKAIVSLVKYRKYQSPVFSAAKVISLASAMVSMLTLETAMLTVFGEPGQENFRRIMIASSGGAIIVIILVMAIVMIVKSTKEIRFLKKEATN